MGPQVATAIPLLFLLLLKTNTLILGRWLSLCSLSLKHKRAEHLIQ